MAHSVARRSRAPPSPTSRMTDVEPSFLEMRHSLLHSVEDSMGEKKHQVHRLICIAKQRSGIINTKIGNHYDQLTKQIIQSEEIAGLLLVYPLHSVHVLEASTDVMIEYLKDMRKQCESDGFFSAAKILVIAHNITTSLFQNWAFNILDIQATGIGEYESTEPTENLVIDMVINIMKIGMFLSKQPKLSYSSAVQTVHERIPESLPQQDILEYFLERNDPALQPVDELLSFYELPYKVTLQSDMVWPMPDHLMPSFS